jgi:chromosome segregation ATPase
MSEKLSEQIRLLSVVKSNLMADIDYNKGRSANELVELEKNYEQKIVKVEARYENRIAEDVSRFMELKNAYDDLTVAAMDDRVNLDEFHDQEMGNALEHARAREEGLKDEINSIKEYAAYVKQRYDEVLENNDAMHDSEVVKLQQDGKEVAIELRHQLSVSKGETNMMQRQNKVLRDTLENRNIKNYELQEQIDKLAKRMSHMKEEEAKLIAELEKESSRANKWESTSGALKRQVVELEKVRKVLTHQLHELRGLVEPKEAKISEMNSKLKSLEHEYENVVTHAAVLEKDTGYKQKRIGSLSETTRKQRNVLQNKDHALQSVVTQVNLCVQELQETGGWKESILFLKKVIAPYLVSSKSDAIRNGLEDAKEQSAKALTLRRLLETKVDNLSRQIANSDGGDSVAMLEKRTEENVELMGQLNEIRVEKERLKKEVLRLKNVIRAKGDGGGSSSSSTSLARSKSAGGLKSIQTMESERQRSMRLLDEMLMSSREEEKKDNDGFGGGVGSARPMTSGIMSSSSALQQARLGKSRGGGR